MNGTDGRNFVGLDPDLRSAFAFIPHKNLCPKRIFVKIITSAYNE